MEAKVDIPLVSRDFPLCLSSLHRQLQARIYGSSIENPIGLKAVAFRLEAIEVRLEAIALGLEAIEVRLEAIALGLEAIEVRLEAIALGLLAIAIRLEAIAIWLEANTTPLGF